jgi:putative ABC transport system ATP-binding protein
MNSVIVKTTNLKRHFDFGGSKIHALDGVDLEIAPGEFIVILGPSGAGKTTLLNMIGGIDNPTEGTVYVDKQELQNYSERQLNQYRREKVGWIFQFFNIVDSLRAWENIGLALEFLGLKDKDEIKKRSYEMLEKVGLKDKEMRFPSQLSGGEQQRVAIARALVKKPKIIVADEPTGNLDYVTGQKIAEIMKKLNEEEEITFIVVSHDVSITQFADRVYHLRSGKIEKISTELNNDSPEFKKVRE